MTFPEAISAVIAGASVRRSAWSPRRAIRLMPVPWSGEEEALLLFDVANKGDVQPYPYHPKGDDMRAVDWIEIKERHDG